MVSTTVVGLQGKTLFETKTSTQILWKIQSRIASTFRKWILISSTKVFTLGRSEPEVPEILEIDDWEDEEEIEIIDDNCEEIPSSRQKTAKKISTWDVISCRTLFFYVKPGINCK